MSSIGLKIITQVLREFKFSAFRRDTKQINPQTPSYFTGSKQVDFSKVSKNDCFGPQDRLHFKCISTVHQLEHKYWKHQLFIWIIKNIWCHPILASKGYLGFSYAKLTWELHLHICLNPNPWPDVSPGCKRGKKLSWQRPRRLQRRERQARSINLKRRKNRGAKTWCQAVKFL